MIDSQTARKTGLVLWRHHESGCGSPPTSSVRPTTSCAWRDCSPHRDRCAPEAANEADSDMNDQTNPPDEGRAN